MNSAFRLLFLIIALTPIRTAAQSVARVVVYDASNHEALPFCTIRYNEGKSGMIGNLDGSFSTEKIMRSTGTEYIEVSCLGYQTLKLPFPLSKTDIYLEPAKNLLQEVTVKSPDGKIRWILNAAIQHKADNNPELYNKYRCHIYYKLIADAIPSDSVIHDTTASSRRRTEFLTTQHLLMSETYSIRTWEKPQKLQEEILSTRFSGLKKSIFTGSITDILPFHAYDNYFKLNGKDYHSPVSKGYNRQYRFGLSDELISGQDTIWILKFKPRQKASDLLAGTVYIHSDGYAISHIIAESKDTILGQTVRLEQQYKKVSYDDRKSRWFPEQLNYIIDRQMTSDKGKYTLYIKGNSTIDSVTFPDNEQLKFDKRHTILLRDGATEHGDSLLATLRPAPLEEKEQRTYHVMDSLGEVIHADRLVRRYSSLADGRLSFGAFDLDIARLLSFNSYENIRLGMGVQTNDKLLKWMSVGGWGGYGFKDKRWKYGGFTEFYLDKRKEFVLRGSYENEIVTPGQIRLGKDIDRSSLRVLLLQRVDNIETYTASLQKKAGYWDFTLSGRRQEITPMYEYALQLNGNNYNRFTAEEVSLNVRYAYAERSTPFLGRYYTSGSDYPICFGKVTMGTLTAGGNVNRYTQAVAAAIWQKHINRLGMERILIEGGKTWSDMPLPISKLFAGNGFMYDQRAIVSLYAFGGLLTMPPNGYYTDRFVQFIYRHDFDKRLYRLESPKWELSSVPFIGIQYNALYGSLDSQSAHYFTDVASPSPLYQEAGLLVNSLIRMRYSGLYYLSLNAGYFYHIGTPFDLKNNGKIVFGMDIEL